MGTPDEIVFLLDVDNTLLDNDRMQQDLRLRLAQDFGSEGRDRYWALLEALRVELGYVDYLGAMQRFRNSTGNDPRLLSISTFLLDYPFASLLYPGAFAAIEYLGAGGPVVILSDGDVIFQPRKIQRSGLWNAVAGRVLVYIHKEQMLNAVAERYPARHYVMVDDKLRLLTAMKEIWAERLTTVFVRQGHYARDAEALADLPTADVTIDHIADLIHHDFSMVRGALRSALPC